MIVKPLVRTLSKKSLRYWLFAVGSIVLGVYLGGLLEESKIWINLRYKIYQSFEWINPRQPVPKRTVLVLIDDNEYWLGRLARRVPIRRDYLADLVRAVDACGPAVIALDFDLRSPESRGKLKENPEYLGETQELMSAIRDVSARRAVVLPAVLGDYDGDSYALDSAVYDGMLPQNGNVRTGYIQLPYDARQVPTAEPLSGGGKIDSFAEAIVRAVNEDLLPKTAEEDSLPYGTFMEEERFPQVLASQLLRKSSAEICKRINHNIALVGASWHRKSFEEGGYNDEHPSPVGNIRGVFVHANYVEALLDSRTYVPLGESSNKIFEILFAIAIALVLAWEMKPGLKFAWVVGLVVFILLISYLFWQNLGIFFDFFFPVVLLLAHAFIDYFRELRADALKLRASEREA